MKKVLSLTLAVLMLLAFFTGCNQNGNSSSADSGSGSNSSEPADDSLQKVLDAGKITVGTSPDFAPSEFIDLSKEGQDQYVGTDMTLARYIAEQLGVELEIKAMDFTTVTASVGQGTVDLGISGFTRTEERAENYDTSIPYNMGAYQGIMIRGEDADKYKSLDDFAGVVIGAQNGSLQHKLITEQLPDCEVKLISTIAEGIMMLQSGRIDALGMSGTSGDGYVRNYPELIMCDIHYDWESPGIVVLMQKDSPALKAKIDEIIQQVNDEDLYDGWLAEAQDLAFAVGANV